MKPAGMDIDAYFARIGYRGERTASLGTLRAIHALHPGAIPFENMDPLLGLPVPLELDSLQTKMIDRRRGGYCFEQNTLFQAVLERLGFSVTSLAGRVVWRLPPDKPPNPRNHMLLKIDLDEGPFIADVGFGGLLFAAPLNLRVGLEQQTTAGAFRFREEGILLTLEALTGSGWQDVYRFTLEPQLPVDSLVANWFTATHPTSRFRNNLVAERLTAEMRISLFNRRLTRRYAGGALEETILETPKHLARALEDEFSLELPSTPERLFERLPSSS